MVRFVVVAVRFIVVAVRFVVVAVIIVDSLLFATIFWLINCSHNNNLEFNFKNKRLKLNQISLG